MRWPREAARRAPPAKISFCALYIRKFEIILSLKGSPAVFRLQNGGAIFTLGRFAASLFSARAIFARPSSEQG
jgi:hypothetical protein